MKTIIFYWKPFIGLLICLCLTGCEDYTEIGHPTNQISPEEVFKDEATATAAITTMYAKLRDEVLLTGNTVGLGVLMGLYADELDYYGAPGDPFAPFFYHQILGSDEMVAGVWNDSFKLIYMANAAMEGLEGSQTLPKEVKNQLLGEALFIRAVTYFYLVNLFGDVPYITSTNYKENSVVSRTPENLVYDSIVADLTEAKTLIGAAYLSDERVRANKGVVAALLARVYLYMNEWEKAESESNLLIDNTTVYNLELNVEDIFLKTSRSAILQLKTKLEGFATTEATTFVFVSGPPPLIALNEDLVQKMEEDLRRLHWVGEVTDGTNTWYYSNKYKQGTGMEYSTVFRLAEQYLIRAEARAMQGDIAGARQDLNAIRQHAGLQNTPASTKDELLQAILKERQLELFAEHGHRWFDLKRYGLATEILAPVKPEWKPTDVNLPIPESELLMNPNLSPQNAGY